MSRRLEFKDVEKLYLVTRRDIPLGQAAAMLVHAGIQAQQVWEDRTPDTVVLLTVEHEFDLADLLRARLNLGLNATTFFEPDLNGELAAVAFAGEPHPRLDRLPLFTEREHGPVSREEEY